MAKLPVVDTPGSTCALCDEPVEPGSDASPIVTPEGPRRAHRECLLRVGLGGIGHLENHSYWCKEMHDPDGGRTLRQSALEVDEWVHIHGAAAAAAIEST